MDRLAEARELREKLRAQGLGGARIHQRFLELAYVDGDDAAIDREVQWFGGKPEEYLSFGLQAATGISMGSVVSRTNCTSEPQRQRCARDSKRRFRIRGSRCACRCAIGQLPDRAATGPFCPGAGNVRRHSQSGETRSGDFEALSKRNHLECGSICWDSRGGRAQSRSTCQSRRVAGIRLAIRALLPRARLFAWHGLPASAQGCGSGCRVPEDRGRQDADWASAWRYPYWGQFYSLSYLGVARGFALAGDAARAKKAFQDFSNCGRTPTPHPYSFAGQGGIRQAVMRKGVSPDRHLTRITRGSRLCLLLHSERIVGHAEVEQFPIVPLKR